MGEELGQLAPVLALEIKSGQVGKDVGQEGKLMMPSTRESRIIRIRTLGCLSRRWKSSS